MVTKYTFLLFGPLQDMQIQGLALYMYIPLWHCNIHAAIVEAWRFSTCLNKCFRLHKKYLSHLKHWHSFNLERNAIAFNAAKGCELCQAVMTPKTAHWKMIGIFRFFPSFYIFVKVPTFQWYMMKQYYVPWFICLKLIERLLPQELPYKRTIW